MIAAEESGVAVDFRESEVWRHARLVTYASFRLGSGAPSQRVSPGPIRDMQEYSVALLTMISNAFTEEIGKRHILFRTAYRLAGKLKNAAADALTEHLISRGIHDTIVQEIQTLQASLHSHS